MHFIARPTGVANDRGRYSNFFINRPFSVDRVVGTLFNRVFRHAGTANNRFRYRVAVCPFGIRRVIDQFIVARTFFLNLYGNNRYVFDALTRYFGNQLVGTFSFRRLFRQRVNRFFRHQRTFFCRGDHRIFISIRVFNRNISHYIHFHLVLDLRIIGNRRIRFPATRLQDRARILAIATGHLHRIANFGNSVRNIFVFVRRSEDGIYQYRYIGRGLHQIVVPRSSVSALTTRFDEGHLGAHTARACTDACQVSAFVINFRHSFHAEAQVTDHYFGFGRFFTSF